MAEIATQLAYLVIRQADNTTDESLIGTPGHCDAGNDYNGKIGLRVSSIFVILVGSMFGKSAKTYVN